jgi:hypothetical protein
VAAIDARRAERIAGRQRERGQIRAELVVLLDRGLQLGKARGDCHAGRRIGRRQRAHEGGLAHCTERVRSGEVQVGERQGVQEGPASEERVIERDRLVEAAARAT